MYLFESLKLYSVHVKKDKEGKIADVVFVKDGFSIITCILCIMLIWPIYHRCWLLALLVIGIWGATELIAMYSLISYGSIGIVQAGCFFIIGLIAHDELRKSLKRRGYEQVTMISGLSKTRAMQRFYDHLGGHAYS